MLALKEKHPALMQEKLLLQRIETKRRAVFNADKCPQQCRLCSEAAVMSCADELAKGDRACYQARVYSADQRVEPA